MDTIQTLISSSISIAVYVIYKIIQRYYIKKILKNHCNEEKISIEIIKKDDDDEKKEIELTNITPNQPTGKDGHCT
jgi:hypothetical protein